MLSQNRVGSLFTKLMFLGFVIVGTYNAVVINADSELENSNIKFVKRLDEMYGIETPGRMVAASTTWKKISKIEKKKNPIIQVVSKIDSAVEEESENKVVTSAAVQEELDMVLSEVINPKRWSTALSNSEFSGNLTTRDGLIENLNVSLPSFESISISFVEMTGNVFEYDYENEIYSGMIYQVDKSSYMVTLTNGPLEGTRLKFMSVSSENTEISYQNDSQLEENSTEVPKVVAGNFGEEVDPNFQPDELSRYDQEIQRQAKEAQTFQF